MCRVELINLNLENIQWYMVYENESNSVQDLKFLILIDDD